MKVIGYHLQKGGVGKTTLSVSTAYSISKRYKTVLVDADPQGNSSNWLVDPKKVSYELADVLCERVSPDKAIVQVRDNLDMLPTFSLDGELKLYGENQLSREPFVFIDLCESLEELGYQGAVFDLSPGMSQLERCVLMATNEVVVPMMPDIFSLDGLETFSNEVRKIEKGFKRKITYNRLVINALNRSIKQHREIYQEALNTTYITYTVGQDPVFRKAQAEHVPAQEMDGKNKMKPEVREELNRLTAALMED